MSSSSSIRGGGLHAPPPPLEFSNSNFRAKKNHVVVVGWFLESEDQWEVSFWRQDFRWQRRPTRERQTPVHVEHGNPPPPHVEETRLPKPSSVYAFQVCPSSCFKVHSTLLRGSLPAISIFSNALPMFFPGCLLDLAAVSTAWSLKRFLKLSCCVYPHVASVEDGFWHTGVIHICKVACPAELSRE